jgi:hypothetical protein
MYAEAVDRAGGRLRELRHQEWGDLATAGAALGLSFAAAYLHPELALPLFIGGLALGALGIRALFRRWDLVDRLVGDRDAYLIPEVRARAAQSATIDRRRSLATSIRTMLEDPELRGADRIASFAGELDALARELDDPELALDPFNAVACERLLIDPDRSPLLNMALPAEDVGSRLRQVRAGFAQSGEARAAADLSLADSG